MNIYSRKSKYEIGDIVWVDEPHQYGYVQIMDPPLPEDRRYVVMWMETERMSSVYTGYFEDAPEQILL